MNLINRFNEPLASRLRPESLNGVFGQDGLVARLQNIKRPTSIIFYGPPGTGKTTIASILGTVWKLPFRSMSGVTSGVSEIRKISEEAEKTGTILLFLDEIHRFSTSQQDSLLHAVEDGRIILIGATTENPAFRINRPLLSRCHVYKLEPLAREALQQILQEALSHLEVGLQANAKEELLNAACGDGRRLIGMLEGLSSFADGTEITESDVREYLASRVIHYDKDREIHYDVISAFIKSIRGSDPDAALFYLAIMLEGGEDPLFIMRRLVILASEDVGNASVHALNLAVSGMTAVEKIGMPESSIIISQVTTFLASCPKSNRSYLAMKQASGFIKDNPDFQIPDHLRNPVTYLHKQEGAGEGYVYPHDKGGFAMVNYFPQNLHGKEPQFYYPGNNGMEENIRKYLNSLWRERKTYAE